MKIAAAIAVLATAAATASAANLSIATDAPNFDPTYAYPGFPDYTLADLTVLGSLDWIRVGEAPNGFISMTGFNEKLLANEITAYQQTGVTQANNGGNHYLSYIDGVSPIVSVQQANRIQATGSFSFRVAAGALTQRHLDLFVSTEGNAAGTLTVTMLDAANNPITSDTEAFSASSTNGGPAVLGVDFLGDNAGDFILVDWAMTGGTGISGITFSAAALSIVPEPTTLTALAGAGLLSMSRRRRA